MNTDLTTRPQPLRGTSIALVLLLTATVCVPLRAQDVKINIGGGNAEEAKADQALAEKLPPDQAAAYLKSRGAWSTVGVTVTYVVLLALPLGIVATVQTFRHRRQKLVHETMRLMIEKGMAVPPELINPPPPVKPPKSDLRRGLVWLAIGLGLIISLRQLVEDDPVWTLGVIPALIGMAYLVCWAVGIVRERRLAGGRNADLWPGLFWTCLGVGLAVALRSLENASGDWDELASWWGLSLIPIGIGAAFLLHALVCWWISRKQPTQG